MANNAGLPSWAVTGVDDVPKSNEDNGALPNWAADDQGATSKAQVASGDATAASTTTSTTATNIEGSTNNNDSEAKKLNWKEMIMRDGRLLLITIVILVCMNLPYIKWLLYPLTLFSTWVHELCHGFAALLSGGRIDKLLIFPDTSGLAYTRINAGAVAFVSSAGYQGTAVVGCILLLFRRTKRGPRAGTMTLGVMMLLSAAIWIRNLFGFFMIMILGVVLCGVAWKLPSARMRDVYVCVAVTCALNAITSVHDLFGSNQYVNGEPSKTDAHSVADALGGPFWLWAIIWLLFALLMTFLGLVFAIPGPDEVADFECCGLCLDLGCFRICNNRDRILPRRDPE